MFLKKKTHETTTCETTKKKKPKPTQNKNPSQHKTNKKNFFLKKKGHPRMGD